MAIEGVDYSFARPGGAKLQANGKAFAVRYLYGGSKGLTNPEIADLHAHGIEIAVVYQEGTGEWKNGFNEGARQARVAQSILNSLDLAHNLPIYFTCDSSDGNSNTGLVCDFVSGASSVLGKDRTGIYGSYTVINAVKKADACNWFWQTYAWSSGNLSAFANLYQYDNGQWNGSVDFTRAYSSEYGQNPPTAPTPTPEKEEEDMGQLYVLQDANPVIIGNRPSKDGDVFLVAPGIVAYVDAGLFPILSSKVKNIPTIGVNGLELQNIADTYLGRKNS